MSEINAKVGWKDSDIVPHVFYQIFGKAQKWMHDDEVVYYSFDAGTYIDDQDQEHEVGTSSISISPAAKESEKNKFNTGARNSAVSVTITAGAKLVDLYPLAIVTIDGVNYDIAKLSSAIVFNMDQDHKISINWVPGELIETFRICPNR